MMSLTMMGLTLVPLVCAIFLISLCVLTNTLVVLVAWGIAFLYQQELNPNVIFYVCRVCINRSQIQRWSTHRKKLVIKLLVFFQI